MKKGISVVLLAYAEEHNLRILIPEIEEKLREIGEEWEIVVIDGPVAMDKSEEVCAGLGVRYYRQQNPGFAEAFKEGIRMARYKTFLILDADFSHDPVYIPKMYERFVEKRADVVIGSRYVKGGRCVGWPFKRWFISRFGGLFIRLMLGVPVKDPTGGFKCFRRSALEFLGDFSRIRSFGYSFQMEMNFRMAKAGLKLKEIPITFTERRAGQSKITGSIATETLKMVWKLRFG